MARHKTVFVTNRGLRHQQNALNAAPAALDITLLRQPDRATLVSHLAQAEYFIIEPWIPWANFLALSLAVQEEPGELVHHLGETRAKLGDLYYIQRLALTLRAYSMELPKAVTKSQNTNIKSK